MSSITFRLISLILPPFSKHPVVFSSVNRYNTIFPVLLCVDPSKRKTTKAQSILAKSIVGSTIKVPGCIL